MSFSSRKTIIEQIEQKRNSKVITLVTSDRFGAPARISSDVIDYLYENLRNFDSKDKKNYGKRFYLLC